MKRPIICLIISLLAGILSCEFLIIDISFIFVFVTILTIFYIKDRNIAIITLLFFVIGFVFTSISYPNIEIDKKVEIEAKVIDKKTYDYGNRYTLKVDRINGKRKSINTTFFNKENFEIMDELILTGNFKNFDSLDNFNTFNYKKYMKTKKIFYEFEADTIEFVAHKETIKYEIREYIETFFEENLEYTPSKFMNSMIIGTDEEDELFEDFRNLGLSHILAISGLHVNILVIFLDSIGKNAGFNKKYYGIFVIVFLVFYGYIISFPVSLIRVIAMYSFNYLNIYLYKPKDNINTVLFGILIVLLANPFFIYSVGFYLSFGAIFSIYYINEKIEKIFPVIPKWLMSVISVQFGTLPFVLYYFNSFNLLSIIANLILIPLMSYGLISGFIYLAIPFLPIGKIIDWIFVFVEYIINGISTISNIFEVKFYSFTFTSIFVYFAFLICVFNYKWIILNIKKYRLSLILLALLIIKPFIFQTVTINFIDVGQGDSFMIRSNETILYDTGGNPLNTDSSGKNYVDYLRKNGVRKVDKIFLSHDDLDHIGNLEKVLENIKVGEIYGNSKKYKSEALNQGTIYRGRNFSIQVILDGKGVESSNDSSLVLLLKVYNASILLTGDIEENEDKIQLNEKIDFLKVAHHGSKHSTRDLFLEQNKIENAIISVGKNRYGHPSDEVLQRLFNKGINILRTDIDGNIEIKFTPYGYYVDYYNKKYHIFDFVLNKLIMY